MPEKLDTRIRPGSGRRKAHQFNKGRQVDETAMAEISALLGDAPRRDLLIEYLHNIQDNFGQLHTKHLLALANWMKLSMAEVFEVATFYAHFSIVDEGEPDLPPVTLRVCESLTCCMAGAEDLIPKLENLDNVRVMRAPCMGRCDQAPVVEVGHNHVVNADFDSVVTAIEKGETHAHAPNIVSYVDYIADGGYTLLKDFRKGVVSYKQISEAVAKSGLRGLGGAGFPSAKKWEFVRAEPKPRMMCINGDEGEPGTFKDKLYLERDPHRFLEGALIGAHIVEADKLYIYMRDEYPAIIEMLREQVKLLEAEGIIGENSVEVRRGAGAYICGEESALIESVEGKRGLPRHRPPFVAQNGVFGRPTLVHNVETVYWLRDIVEKGPEVFTDHGRHDRVGLRSFSVSGDVQNPGVKLAPAGITLQELVDEYCGGIIEGHSLKAYLPGGASGGILPASLADIPLDFDTLQPHGCFIGSAAVIVLSDKRNMKDVALNLMKFFEDESCGQCTPCRNGTTMAVKLMGEDVWDADLLGDLANVMMEASICGLGQAAPNPLLSVMKHFPEDVLES